MIYTFGDGFAAGHIWPEWPQILSAVATEPVVNCGYPGAGNDFIFSTALEIALTAPPGTFIIQWAPSRRFDKLIEDDSWNQTIQSDSKYAHAVYCVQDKTWWLSSGSDQLAEYHSKYQQPKQQLLFDIYHMLVLHDFLINRGHRVYYCLTYDFDTDQISDKQLELIDHLPWINHLAGMDSVIDPADRGEEIQPLPIGHALWVQSFLSELINPAKLAELIELIQQQTWLPYDPDRESIWNNLVNQLS